MISLQILSVCITRRLGEDCSLNPQVGSTLKDMPLLYAMGWRS
jgi:hypothetical protein